MTAARGIDSADAMVAAVNGGAPAHFAAPPRASSEAAEAARALAIKLGCGSAILLGCIRDPIARAMQYMRLVGFDAPPIVAETHAGDWHELTDWTECSATITEHANPDVLLMVNAGLILTEESVRDGLRAMLAISPAAVLFDPDGRFVLEDLAELERCIETAGLKLEHRSLVRSPAPGSYQRLSPYVVVTDGHDPRPGYILAAGARGLATDPAVDVAAELGRPLRVCVASYEVIGPTRNGGIGTANTMLARALASAGHEVTLLFTGFPQDGPIDEPAWNRHYGALGIEFEVLGQGQESWVQAPHVNVRRAYEFYAWLRDRPNPYDVVHFPECQGHAYYAVMARRQGRMFRDTLFVAGVHSSTRWCEEANREVSHSIDALVDDHLERKAVELADVVVSPSAYMLDYMREREWRLPQRRFVQQYVLPARRASLPRDGERTTQIREIVFFGRLEVRKGLETFCDALDQLAETEATRELEITFLGRPEHILGEPSVDYLKRRAHAWPWSYKVEGSLLHDETMARLSRGELLVVMPSTVDNSPNTVSEALGLEVPFVCSRSGGTGELIDPRDLLASTFPGLTPDVGIAPPPVFRESAAISSSALCDRLRVALQSPVLPRFAVDHRANEEIHVGWNVGAAVAHHAATSSDDRVEGPRLSVGILHRDQPAGLAATLQALASQRHELVDVTVVDDNSVSAEGLRQLTRAEHLCAPFGWQVIRRTHQHAAEAREQLIANGRGDAFLFLRSSESISDGALRSLREALERTGADIVTGAVIDPGDAVSLRESPGCVELARTPTMVPLAGPALVGMLYPAFSAGPYAVTRSALERLRGFTADARGDDADADLLNRAVLAGCSLEVIPEPIAEVMHADQWRSMRAALTVELGQGSWDREALPRITRPFSITAPTDTAPLAGLYAALHTKLADDRVRSAEADRVRHRQAEYIGYLELEHRTLSARIHELEATDPEREPARRRLRRLLGNLRRLARSRSSG